MRCHAGCPQAGVIAALQERELWPKPPPNGRRLRPRITRHELRDTAGRLVAVHERRDWLDGQKGFTWRKPTGGAGLNGVSVSALPLYGSEGLAGLPKGAAVVVTEGEKALRDLRRQRRMDLKDISKLSGVAVARLMALEPRGAE